MSDMTPRIEPHNDDWAYVLPLRTELARSASDMLTWRLADETHSVITAIAKARQGKALGYDEVKGAQRLVEYAEELRNEILERAAADGMSIGQIATAMDAPRSTAQTRLEAAQSRQWRRGWLANDSERSQGTTKKASPAQWQALVSGDVSEVRTPRVSKTEARRLVVGGDSVSTPGSLFASTVNGRKIYEVQGSNTITINNTVITVEPGDTVVTQGFRVTATDNGLKAVQEK